MLVTEALFEFQNEVNDLTSSVANPIEVGQCSEIRPQIGVNVCGDFVYESSLSVSANPPNGKFSQLHALEILTKTNQQGIAAKTLSQ